MITALSTPSVTRSGTRHTVVNGLASIFNVIALTVCVVVMSLTVVGLPLAWSAASSALFDWRRAGESRVLRTYWVAVATQWLRRTIVVGPAVLVVAVGGVEVAYFLHYRGPVAVLCLTTGLVTLAGGLSFTSYLLLLVTVAPTARWAEIWRCAAALVARTSPTATPAFVLETALAALAGYTDPALLVVAVPVMLLWSWLRTAIWGARRAGLDL